MKDKTPKPMKSFVVYRFSCPGCRSSDIGKTERNLATRIEEHACTDKASAIYNHINSCSGYEHLKNVLRINNDRFSPSEFDIVSVGDNTDIIDSASNWNILLIKEALHIKRWKPDLNNGLKASKELQLFG